jgi:hypothetical protein
MKSLAPVLDLLRSFFAPRVAWLVRLHVSQLNPLAPAQYHRRYALLLASLERAAHPESINKRTCAARA